MKQYLIIKPSSMGDILHAFPAVAYLHRKEPEAVIDWLIHPAFDDLLDYLPGIRKKIHFKRSELGNYRTFFPAFLSLLREIRAERYDMVIDLQGLMRSAVIGRFVRSGKYYGPAVTREKAASCFYKQKIFVPEEILHAVERNCALMAQCCSADTVPGDYLLPVVEKHRTAAETLLSTHGISCSDRILAVAPGARWVTKQWPPAFFAQVIAGFSGQFPDAKTVLIGSPGDRVLSAEIIRSLKNSCNVFDLTGETTVGSMIEVIRSASVLLCNDSGPMHAAASVGTPVVAFFGPTDPALTGPYCKIKEILQPELDCIRCFRKQCGESVCHQSVSASVTLEKLVGLFKKGE